MAVYTVFNRKSFWRNILVVFLLGCVYCLSPVKSVHAATWTVCAGGCNYTTIQAAINAAGTVNGDMITVMSAVHTEFNVNVTKNLTIQGLGTTSTIVQANATANHSLNRRVFNIPAGVTATIQDMTLRYGDITSGSGGGAILVAGGGTLTLNRTIVTNNRSSTGGGGIRSDGTMTINNSTIRNNTASGAWGGAIDNNFGGTMTINNSTINNNTASVGNGGGLDNYGSTQTTRAFINNSTFSGNYAAGFGGGIYNRADGGTSTVTLSHVTIVNNTVNTGNGGGIFSEGTNIRYIEFRNTIIANNVDNGGQAPDCSGTTLTSLNYNLIENLTGCTIGGTTTNNLTGIDPNQGALTYNGGPTYTHALLADSQAINHIPNGTNGCGTTYTTDQRGVARPFGSNCDIGAFEYVASLVIPGVNGGLGPGGIGHTDGSTPLELWLQAGKGVFTNVGCTTAATNGNDVACWQDQSGNGYNYTQATSSRQPNYFTGIKNNQPVLRFYGDGNPDNLDSSAVLAAGDDTFTYFASWMATASNVDHVIFEQNHTFAQTGRRAALIAIPSALYGFNGLNNDFHNAAPYVANQYEVSSVILNGNANNNVLVYDSGRPYVGTINITTQNIGAGGSTVGRYTFATGYDMRGDIPEIIVYSNSLNDIDRILVENYLSAKYDVPLDTANGAVEAYDGDTVGNGDFDLDVAGIGRFGGNNHIQAHAAGMIVVNGNFLQDNGDWLLFGHRTLVNSNTTADLPTGGAWNGINDVRWARHWYIDVTDAAGVNCATPGTCFVDIVFDFSEGGMVSVPNTPVSNYRLLKRAGTTGSFSDIATATAVVGDQVQFLNVDVSLLGSNFTLGSIDGATSPTAITTQQVASSVAQVGYPVLIAAFLVFLTVATVVVWRRRA